MAHHQPRLLVRGPTIDFELRGHSPDLDKEAERALFIRHDTRSPSPSGDNPEREVSPTGSKEFTRVKKGDIEMLQLISTGTAIASIASDMGLKLPALDTSLNTSVHVRAGRSACKTVRQIRDQPSIDEIDEASLIRNLLSLSKNSPSGASPLHYAQTNKNFPPHVSQTLVDQLNIDINVVDNDGDTPLHWAVTHSHVESIEWLLSRGANEHICNKSEEAPIHLAIKGGLIDATRILFGLEGSSRIQYSYRGRNYLHLACEQNDIQMVTLILSCCPKGRAGDDILDLPVPLVTLLDHDNLTPIHTAAKKCDYRILDLLLHQLEDAEQKESSLLLESREGFTPLHYSVDAGNLNNVKLLLKHGASPLTASRQQQISSLHLAAIRTTSSSHNEILTELLTWGKGIDPNAVDIRDSLDRSPLHYAATYDHVHSATILEAYGASLDSIDREGSTPLIVAASKGANKVLKFLLAKGADVTAQNHKGRTALLIAIEEGHWKTSRELLTCPNEKSKSLLVLIPDDNGQSPLHVICKGGGDFKTISMLMALHADVNMHDKNRRIPLHYACHFGSYSMGYKLLQEGVWGSMLNDVDGRGHTSLHMAARKGHYDLVKLLLQKGAHITKSLNYDSAFSLACKDGHLKCAQLLYKSNDTILNWQNAQGHSPLHLAAMSGHKDTVLWLLDIDSLLLWDRTEKSFADIAIERKEQILMSAVLEHRRWREVMKFCSPVLPPPFVSLVKFLPDQAKVILERSLSKSATPREHNDYFERVDFSFLNSNSSEEAIHRASSAVSRTRVQRSLNHEKASKIGRKRNIVSQDTEKLVPPPKKKETIFSRLKSHYTLDNLLRSRYVYEDSSLHALHTMIEHYRIGLLTHPVTKTYLDYKWRTYGRIYYTVSILPFFIFLFLLTTEVLFVYLHVQSELESSGVVAKSNGSCSSFYQFNRSMLMEKGFVEANRGQTNFFEVATMEENVTRIYSETNFRCQCHPVLILRVIQDKEVFIIIPLYIFAFIVLLTQTVSIIKQPILFWFSALNLMELGTVLMALTVREQLGINIDRAALAVFLGYGALFLQLKRYSWSGLYVTMFLEVIYSMIKTILVFLPVLFAYVLIFFIMISPSIGFNNILESIVRIPVMLVGELDFYDSFLGEADCYRNKEMVYGILIIFIFGITISFANLLIGLAVGDIDNILKQAVVSKSIEQVNWLTEFELGPIFPFFKKWIRWDHFIVFPNKKKHLFAKLIAHIDVFGIFSQLYTSQNELNSDISDPNLLFLISLKEENNNLKMQLQQATDEISNVQTSLTKVFAVVQKMDQKLDTITANPEEIFRTLPRPSSVDRRLTVDNSQSQ